VRKGEVLLRLDPADYENTLTFRKSDLRSAQAALELELGRQNVALEDYEMLGEELEPQFKALALRKPQLDQAQADVISAQAAVDQAQLSLDRTVIKAPFDAHIITMNANVGSQVSPGDNLGRIVGMDEYWVMANVPIAKINWLDFSEGDGEGASVRIMNENIWPKEQYREGTLFRMVGALDDETRLARVLVSVPDPLARKSANLPPLMIGTFVETHIEAKEIKDVVRLERKYLRKDETVWVKKGNALDVRKVNIRFQDALYAYIDEGLEADDEIIITSLSTVVPGSKLRTEAEADN
jgi:RND family efflux transporter MFP subunit